MKTRLLTTLARAAFCRRLAPGIVLFGTLLVNAFAQNTGSPIVVPAATATGIGLASAANYQLGHGANWKDYEDVAILSVLNGVYTASANAGQTTPDFSGIAAQLRTALDAKMPAYPVFADEGACLRYTIDSLMPLLNSGPDPSLKAALAALENVKLTQLESPVNPALQYPANMGMSAVTVNAYQFVGDQVQESSDLAHDNPTFAAAVSPVMIDFLGLDTSASYSQIATAFPSAVPTLPAANGDGSFTLNSQDLLAQYQTVIAQVQASIEITLGTMLPPVQTDVATASPVHSGAIPIQGGDPPQSPPTCKTAVQIVIATDSCTPDLANGAQGTITGISKLFSLFNSGTASQISTVGGAIVNAGKAISQLGIISSGGGALGAVADVLGVLGPVGSLIGAGVSIFESLFGGGTNPNAAVLQQIQQLSQQIATLQTDMNSQFNQVNANLNTILTTLNTNFAQIDFQLGVLNGNVQDVQASLLDIQTQLNQLAVYSLIYAQTLSYETFMLDLKECPNFQATHPGEDIGLTGFNNCESELYVYAFNNASDGIWGGAQQPSDYSVNNIYNVFLDATVQGVCSGCATPFSTDVNYLAQFPALTLGLPALSNANARLPNPDIWTIAARSYLQLMRQWPQYAGSITSDLDDVIQVGANLQQAIHNANTIAGASGPVANQNLFNALLTQYTAAANNLNAAFQGKVQQVEDALGVQQGTGFNLWGGPDQPTTSVPKVLKQPTQPIPYYGPNGPAITPPPGLVAPIPMAVKLAEELNLGSLQLFYAVGDPDTAKTVTGVSLSGVVKCSAGGSRYIEIFGLLSVLNLAVFDRVGFYCITPASASDAQVVQDWQNNLGGMQSSWVTNSFNFLSSTQLQALDQKLDPVLTNAQQNLYAGIATAFGSAGDAVQLAGQELTGVKTLIQAYASFGLPQSLQNSDELQAALYGPAALKDAAITDPLGVPQDFVQWSKASPALTDNRIADELTAISLSSTNLQNALGQVLAQIQRSGTPDSLPEIDATLQDLQAFETVKNASALSACAYQLSSTSSNMASAGGQLNVTVTTIAGCTVTASSGSSWLNVSTTQASPTTFQITIKVAAAAAGVSRSGIVVAGDQVYRISQYPSSDACLYSLTTQAATFAAAAASGSVGVVAGAGCAWSVTASLPAWFTISSGTSGNGNGTVKFSLSANTALTDRSAKLTIAGMTVTVTQLGNISGGKIVSPVPGSTLSSTQVTFQWTAGTGTTNSYQLAIGTTGPGSWNIVSTFVTGTSVTVSVPRNGSAINVRLYSQDASSGAYSIFNDYTYTEEAPFRAIPLIASVTLPPHVDSRRAVDRKDIAVVNVRQDCHVDCLLQRMPTLGGLA